MRTSEALRRAEEHVRGAGADVELDPHVQHLLGDACTVHGQQQYRRLSLYPHSIVFTIEADGRVRADGALLELHELDVIPALGPEAAAMEAFRHMQAGTGGSCHTQHAPQLAKKRYLPKVVSAFSMPNRPTVLAQGPFADAVQAHLIIFAGAMPRLAWLIAMHVGRVADYAIVVDAANGAVLDCAYVVASACVASVLRFNRDEEPPRDVEFPRPVADYPPGMRAHLQLRDWVAADQPEGNNVAMRIGTKKCTVPSVLQGALRRFTPAPASLEEQAVNAFFVCNFMHDFFSCIGFAERDGNFQQQNFEGEGRAGDRLDVAISSGPGANMRAQNDGTPAELTLGVWQNDSAPFAGNPTALDGAVVIHEFVHGVSQRLVSGRLAQNALAHPQGLALGEAWSDYFAVTILNFYREPAKRRFTFAEYASKKPNGARPHPYDNFRADVRSLGTKPFHDQHGAGSIFAAALIRMHDALRALFRDDDRNTATGQETSWRLVVDSMKQLKTNPTFIDARNALLESNKRLALPEAAQIAAAIRGAFANFGMGATAACRNTSLKGFSKIDFNP